MYKLMKSKILLFFFLCCTLTSLFGATKTGSGKMATKSFKVGVSQRIDLKQIKMRLKQSMGGEYTCSIIIGNKNEVKITTDNNLINDLSMIHEDKTTTVLYDGAVNLQPSKLHVDIYTNKLSSINAVGVCKVHLEGGMNLEELMIDLSSAAQLTSDSKMKISKGSIDMSGASSLQMNGVYFDELMVDVAGGSKIELHGRSVKFSADIAGASTADLKDFVVETIRGEISGGATCFLNCASSIKLGVYGGSDATVHGSCNDAEFDVAGGASLNASKLKAKDVKIDSSGASHSEVYVSRTLRAESSGASSIKYYGNPSRVTKDTSGAGSISRD